MELLIVTVIGGVFLAAVLVTVIWRIVSSATDNLFDWLIHTFGNEQAVQKIEAKWAERENK